MKAQQVASIEDEFLSFLERIPGDKAVKQEFFRRHHIAVARTNYASIWEGLVNRLDRVGAAKMAFRLFRETAPPRLLSLVEESKRGPVTLRDSDPALVEVLFFNNGKRRKLTELLVEYMEEQPETDAAPVAKDVTRPRVAKAATESPAAAPRPKVFLVHGRDNGAKHEVARFLERIGIEAVILHERTNAGRTLITKFQEESGDIEFAVVLMTPDDVGGLKDGAQKPRARQNVIFELGFFIGKLGASKVCALVAGEVERPSDFEAVVYVAYDENGAWRSLLARELRGARVKFDPHGVF